MRLSPILPRTRSHKKKTVSWNDTQQEAVVNLLHEASALIDIFDQMSIILGPEVKLNNLPEKPMETVEIPKSKWDPILTESCNSLQEKITNFKPHSHLNGSDFYKAKILK